MISRQTAARAVRQEAAELAFRRLHPSHLNNGDESDYRNAAGELSYIGNFHKGLQHNAEGDASPSDYRALRRALDSGDPADFEAIPLAPNSRPLVNPQAGLAFDLQGPDAHALAMPPAPRIDSAEAAGEIADSIGWRSSGTCISPILAPMRTSLPPLHR